MTQQQKLLAFHLLHGAGYYLMHKKKGNGIEAFMLYKGNQIPVEYYSVSTVRYFKNVLKTDSKKRMTINLSLVRQLHGRSQLKKSYNGLKSKIVNNDNT